MALPSGRSEGGEEEKGFENDVTVRCCPLAESAPAMIVHLRQMSRWYSGSPLYGNSTPLAQHRREESAERRD